VLDDWSIFLQDWPSPVACMPRTSAPPDHHTYIAPTYRMSGQFCWIAMVKVRPGAGDTLLLLEKRDFPVQYLCFAFVTSEICW
jgi:hypothetical protein